MGAARFSLRRSFRVFCGAFFCTFFGFSEPFIVTSWVTSNSLVNITRRSGGFASEHDQKIARWVAYILAGGRVTAGSLVSEQYLLDLEREAFLSLCGERKSQERIAHTLKTGKPLRN